jgi:Uma2 family endonuclease
MSAPLKSPARRTRAARATPTDLDGSVGPLGAVIPSDWPVAPDGLPTLFEDEGQDDMGENNQHRNASDILFYGVKAHLAGRSELAVLANMNVYYRPSPDDSYVSPDVMVVRPPQPLPADLPSYRLGVQGPAPVFAAEVLSRRSYQQQDLSNKPVLYHRLGVAEYLLIDVLGLFFSDGLLLKRRTARGWKDQKDADGGVSSAFGFRVVIDADEKLRVLDAATGHRYARPDEADAEAQARRVAEDRIRELEAQLARLKAAPRRGGKKTK